jgi:hypothetical protein
MNHAVFGNLKDWGEVLEKLKTLLEAKELDAYQDELIRLLRFDQNWRLREAAIESLPLVSHPSLELAREVLSIVKRKDLYYDVRILAADCLDVLARKIVDDEAFDKDLIRQFIQGIIQNLDALLSSPEPPKFSRVLEKARQSIREIKTAV